VPFEQHSFPKYDVARASERAEVLSQQRVASGRCVKTVAFLHRVQSNGIDTDVISHVQQELNADDFDKALQAVNNVLDKVSNVLKKLGGTLQKIEEVVKEIAEIAQKVVKAIEVVEGVVQVIVEVVAPSARSVLSPAAPRPRSRSPPASASGRKRSLKGYGSASSPPSRPPAALVSPSRFFGIDGAA
jgi:hypothetical protein